MAVFGDRKGGGVINFCYRYKDFIYRYNSTFSDLVRKDISQPCFYGDVLNKDKSSNLTHLELKND